MVNYDRFKRPILFFEMNTVKKSDVLERGFWKQLGTIIIFAPYGVLFQKKKQNRKKGLKDEHGKLYIAADVLPS